MGVVDDAAVADALVHQSGLLRLASACYVLGYADEESLARGLSKQIGVPAVVLDRSIIRLSVLEGVPRELATRINVLPVYEDAERILVAVDDLEAAREALHELQILRGKPVLPHVALRVTLARAIRASFNAMARGQRFLAGAEADAGAATEHGSLVVVSDVDGMDLYTSALPDALVEDVTKEVDIDLLPIDDDFAESPRGRRDSWSGSRPIVDDGSVDTHGDTAGGSGAAEVSGDISVDSVLSPSSVLGGTPSTTPPGSRAATGRRGC
jgi:hypothetical protein